MRRAARVDRNQAEIVAALEMAGATVASLAMLGRGVPDLLVGFEGVIYLFEIKFGNNSLTPDQVGWHRWWQGRRVDIVTSVEQALQIIGARK